MDTIRVEKLDEVFLKIHCNIAQSLEIKEYFSCKVPNYYFNPRYKAGYWDGTISFFNRNEQTIPIGLMPMLYTFAEKYRYHIRADFDTTTMINDITEEELQEFYKAIFKNSSYFPRDYQAKSVYKAIRRKRGVIESATASGKSLVIYTLIRFLLGTTDRNILIVVPNIGLVNQMFNDFIDYGWDSCQNYVSVLYHGKRPNFNKPVLVSTWQSIYKKPESFFEKYGSVIADECISGESLIKMSNGDYKKIKDVEIGDEIISFNIKKHVLEKDIVLKKYENLLKSSSEEMYEIELEDGKIIKITGNHKILTNNRGYVEAKNITENDDIVINT